VSLRFAYRPFQVARPLVTLAGRLTRPRPVIPVTIISPTGTLLTGGLLDTGADDTILLETVAQQLGIDLSNTPTASGAGFGMQAATVRFAEVTLRIADPNEQREWQAWVGFTTARLRQPLLGYAGFLQFFTATFHGDHEQVELTVNATYSGT
jgi:predicted aspartyl protease